MTSLVVLPDDAHAALFAHGAEGTERVAPLPLVAAARSSPLSADNAVAAFDETHVASSRRTADGQVLPPVTLALPAGLVAHCAARVGDTVFVAGRTERPHTHALFFADCADARPGWRPLPLPLALQRPGKAIDALLPDGERLIAVDDILAPKYLLTLDVADPSRPRLTDCDDLPSYGHIFTAAVGGDWIALGQATFSHGTSGIVLSALGRRTLRERAYLHREQPGYRPFDEVPFRDLALDGERLYLALGRRGVGVLPHSLLSSLATGEYALELPDPPAIVPATVEVTERVIALPGHDGCFAVGTRGDAWCWEWVSAR